MINKDNFHPAVKLLLARMESNPEEFVGGYRWSTVLNTVREHARKEEKDTINSAYKLLQLDAAHDKIMKELLCEGSTPTVTIMPHPPMPAGQIAHNGNWGTLANISTAGETTIRTFLYLP